MARTYRARCYACGAEWTGEEADGADVPEGFARAFYVCRDCGHVGRASVRLTAEELQRYALALRKTIGKMTESYLRAKARLEERCRSLRQRVRAVEAAKGGRGGDEKTAGALRAALKLTEGKLAKLAAPDVDHLEKRLSAARRAEREAPPDVPPGHPRHQRQGSTAHPSARQESAGRTAAEPSGSGTGGPRCSECGGRTTVHRETIHGYEIACPRCGGKIHTRVR